MNFRRIAFNAQDFLKGNHVNKHYNEVVNFFTYNRINEKGLSNLLDHARENVPFYDCVNSNNLKDFPVLDKNKIKSSINLFKAKNFLTKKVLTISTSGSTGTPFTVYHDLNKKARNHADTLYFGKLGGYVLGNKLIYLKIWVKEKMQSSWLYKLQNISPIDVINLNNKEIESLLGNFKNNSKEVHSVLGYVSALEQIIRYCEQQNISDLGCRFSGVITMSEGLSYETRQKLQALFKCPVVSRYSNLENGIIAQQEIDNDHFLVNTASYLVEIFHMEKDVPVADGCLGRIVVTDLYNYAMPMIRYDTGDMGIKILQEGKTYLKSVEGRKLDLLFNTSGEMVSSYIMYKNMWKYNEIEQYQLIQNGEKSYEFKINCSRGFTKEKQLVKEFKSYLGSDANFLVTYVDGIPLLNSGKHRKTVNLYRKN